MQQINLVRATLSCRGQHVDPEYCLDNGCWRREGSGEVVETIERQEGESDITFFDRVNVRAAQLDRGLHCSRCYRN